MARTGLTNGLLTAALVACGLLVAALVYGFATRTLTPRTSPVATATDSTASADSARAETAVRNRITVEVLNGTRQTGLAARARELLRRRGFDVQEVGTTAAADSTVVTILNGTPADAAHVAGALGLPEWRVVAGAADENATTVSVTLGADVGDFDPLHTIQ